MQGTSQNKNNLAHVFYNKFIVFPNSSASHLYSSNNTANCQLEI